MRRSSLVLAAGLLATAAGCAHKQGTAADGRTELRTSLPVRVVVVNHWELPMEIYVEGSGINHRLGLVNAGMERTFVLPQAVVGAGRVEFVAQPSGTGQGARSGLISISPGDVVDFEITTHLGDSRATVRQ